MVNLTEEAEEYSKKKSWICFYQEDSSIKMKKICPCNNNNGDIFKTAEPRFEKAVEDFDFPKEPRNSIIYVNPFGESHGLEILCKNEEERYNGDKIVSMPYLDFNDYILEMGYERTETGYKKIED